MNTIRLSDLTTDQRRLVLALVEAGRTSGKEEDPAMVEIAEPATVEHIEPPDGRATPSYWMGEVAVSRLRLDPTYQRRHDRAASKNRIDRMAAAWDDGLAGTVIVSERSDGWYVIDGGHRFLAARRAGIKVLRAIVWKGLTREGEARLYRRLNTGTVRPSAMDLFRSKLAEGDPAALSIQRVTTECDVRIDLADSGSLSKNPEVTRAIAALEVIHNQGGPQTLGQVLRTLREAWPDSGGALGAVPLFGVGSFIWTYQSHPRFNYPRVAVKLGERSLKTFLQAAHEMGGFNPTGGGSGTGRLIHKAGPRRAVLVAYNRKLRDPLPDATMSDFKQLSLGRNPWTDPGSVV